VDYSLFIKCELTLTCISLGSMHLSRSNCAKHLRYYLDCSVTLCPDRAKKWTLSELHLCHLALEHCRGGRPVPRAQSLLRRRSTCIR